MRQIEISNDTFAMIWTLRTAPEANEEEVLSRILREKLAQTTKSEKPLDFSSELEALSSLPELSGSQPNLEVHMIDQLEPTGKVRWVDDVKSALARLGGQASLADIYRTVRSLRAAAGRSLPETLEATIRRTLEDHSSDSANFRGEDLFTMPYGHGQGIWALRKR